MLAENENRANNWITTSSFLTMAPSNRFDYEPQIILILRGCDQNEVSKASLQDL